MADYDWFSFPRYDCGFQGCKTKVWKATDICPAHEEYRKDMALKAQLARLEAEANPQNSGRHRR